MKREPKSRPVAIVYGILRILILITAIRAGMRQDYQSVFLCLLSLLLMVLPKMVARKLKISLSPTFEIIIMLFIFAAEILGELSNFYVTVPHWDTMLHTLNGFLCAAIGFALVDMLNRGGTSFKLSPLYLALAAFCFSMTVGVLWEFGEFAVDVLLGFDAQKDTVVQGFGSVFLDPTKTNQVIPVRGVADVIVVYADGSQQALGVGGWLDIGLYDTMKDLLVNFIGAALFCVLGYFYEKKGVGVLVPKLVPRVLRAEEENLEDI